MPQNDNTSEWLCNEMSNEGRGGAAKPALPPKSSITHNESPLVLQTAGNILCFSLLSVCACLAVVRAAGNFRAQPPCECHNASCTGSSRKDLSAAQHAPQQGHATCSLAAAQKQVNACM